MLKLLVLQRKRVVCIEDRVRIVVAATLRIPPYLRRSDAAAFYLRAITEATTASLSSAADTVAALPTALITSRA